jgi:hypothetical protein
VTTDELLAVLNGDAERMGSPPIDARVLRFWVDRRLIGVRAAKGRGRGFNPTWHFSEAACQYARAILELKSKGIRRVAALRIHLWVLKDDYPIEGVRNDLRAEFVRFRKRQRRASPFDYDHRDRARLSNADIAGEMKKLFNRFDTLPGIEFLTPRMVVDAASELMWGEEGRKNISSIPFKMAKLAGVSTEPLNVDISIENFGGIFGSPDEIERSGEEILRKVGVDDLFVGRLRFQRMKLFFDASAGDRSSVRINEEARQFLELTDGVVSLLSMFVIQAFRERVSVKAPSTPPINSSA